MNLLAFSCTGSIVLGLVLVVGRVRKGWLIAGSTAVVGSLLAAVLAFR